MSKAKVTQHLSPCGLHCSWCPYHMKGRDESGCNGCLERERCPIRDCAAEEGRRLCTDCGSFPCATFLQGFQCMWERYTF
ncbi:MAG: DUF3795 domain-containing protein [Candidatus Bathyarchaeia archaeon]